MIISPCNGLRRCWRHPMGCAKIVFTSQEEYELRQKYKARRRRLWNIVLEHYRLGTKWGLDPIPRKYHLKAVLLMEQILGEQELSQSISEGELKIKFEQKAKKRRFAKVINYFLGRDS